MVSGAIEFQKYFSRFTVEHASCYEAGAGRLDAGRLRKPEKSLFSFVRLARYREALRVMALLDYALRSVVGSMYIGRDGSLSLSLNGKLPPQRNGEGIEHAHLH